MPSIAEIMQEVTARALLELRGIADRVIKAEADQDGGELIRTLHELGIRVSKNANTIHGNGAIVQLFLEDARRRATSVPS